MNWLKARHLFSLVFLLVGCESRPISTVMDTQQTLKDEFEGVVRNIDIQPGTGKDPNVCYVKKDGQLVCHASGQQQASFTAFRNMGPLSDISGPCVVTRYGSLACIFDGREQKRAQPLDTQMLHRISLIGPSELCALVNDGNGNLGKCYDGQKHLQVAYPGTMTVTNHDGATVQKIDHVVSIDQARENGSGDRIACGRMTSGRSWCYNVTTDSKIVLPDTLRSRSIAVNDSLRCVASPNGQLSCEKLKGGSVSLPGVLRKTEVVEVTGRDQRMCARYANGDFACWEGTQIYNRRRFNTFQKVMKVQPSRHGICAVFADERTRCLEPATGSLVAYQELHADAVVASNDQTCSTTADGTLQCWGQTRHYNVPKNLPFPTGHEVAVGSDHLCYADDGRVLCQGNNEKQQLEAPTELASEYVIQLAASNQHTCALTQSQKVFCWGENAEGSTTVPSDLGAVKSITTGKSMSCAIDKDDQLRCWGMPFLVSDAKKVKKVREVAIGDTHFCVLDENKQPSCYGSKGEGKTIPFPAPNGFVQLKAGANHTCAIDDKSLAPYCWGSNSGGQTDIPEGLDKALKLALGAEHSCAIDHKNKVVCWGRDQARDIEGRFELHASTSRQEYRGGLVRHVPFKKPIAPCEGGNCTLPEEPLVSFKGLSLTQSPVNETYALWVDYQTSCPAKVEWMINGTIKPDLTVDKNNVVLTNPHELRKKAMFYKLEEPLTRFDSAKNGTLTGPSILEARIRTSDGRLVRNLPANCNLQINTIVIIPSGSTTTAWTQMTVSKDSDSYVERLKDSLTLLTQYKQIEESQVINTRKTAVALHEQLQTDYLSEVKAAIDMARDSGAGADLDPMTTRSSPDDIRNELMLPVTLQLLGAEGQTEPYETFSLKPVKPAWYESLYDYIEPARISTLDSNEMSYSLSIDLLNAPISADTDGRIRRLAGRLARGPIQIQMRKVARFLKETGVVREFLEEASRMAREDLQSTLDETSPVERTRIGLGGLHEDIVTNSAYQNAKTTIKDFW